MPKHWAIPGEIDHEKFKARYGLTDADFKVGPIGSKWYLIVFDIALTKVTDDPPITEPIGAPREETPEKPPVRLAAGTARQGTAPVAFKPGTLATYPQLGAVEFVDDGVNGHLYVTVHVGGVLKRVQLV